MITIEKTGEFFRLLYDVKGRFVCHRISSEESAVSSHYHLFTVIYILIHYIKADKMDSL